jgi:hypothetical protein
MSPSTMNGLHCFSDEPEIVIKLFKLKLRLDYITGNKVQFMVADLD